MMEVRRAMTPEEATKLVGQQVPTMDPTHTVNDTTYFDADTGDPVLMVRPLPVPAAFRRAVLTIDCSTGVGRANNYRSRSRTFGYAPRRPVTRREGCSMAHLGVEMPEVERVLEDYAAEFATELRVSLPDVAKRDYAVLEAVTPDWKFEGTPWTSGVVNDTAQLPYHRDGNNFPTWSVMPVVRRGTTGGHLHIPEYGLTIACRDSTVIYFQGSRWVHGVTPIVRGAADGYRISVVYYALAGLKNCREYAEELAYAQERRTQREADMAERIAAGDMTIPGHAGDRNRVVASWRGTGAGDNDQIHRSSSKGNEPDADA